MKELPLQSVVNLRDFGATQTKDRKTVKIGLFLRSAALNRLSKKDAAALRDKYGVRTVIDLRTQTEREQKPYVIGSAVFAALTSILGKIGISDVESNLGTAIRTGVVLVIAWLIVFVKGKGNEVKKLDRKELVFIALSGIATGASWLCYYYAIQNGIVSVVVPIDKLSVVVSVAFSCFVFKEKMNRKAIAGLILIVVGTLTMAIWA